jgi:hypothetical protein
LRFKDCPNATPRIAAVWAGTTARGEQPPGAAHRVDRRVTVTSVPEITRMLEKHLEFPVDYLPSEAEVGSVE